MDIFLVIVGLAVGAAAGFFGAAQKFKKEATDHTAVAKKVLAESEQRAAETVRTSEHRAGEVVRAAEAAAKADRHEATEIRMRAEKLLTDAKAEADATRQKADAAEKRLNEKELNVDKKLEDLDKKRADLETRAEEIVKTKTEAERYRDEQKGKLEQVAGLSREEAKAELVVQIEKDSEDDLVKKIRAAEAKATAEADKHAQNIIAGAIQRLANEVTTESTVTTVALSDDSLKGRIIGREGRNITAFEMATGVDVIVDDTPGVVIISGFDLVRRNVAKQALEALLKDGRLHPAKIEEAVKKAQKDLDRQMQELGEKAVLEVGVVGLPPQIVKLLGRLNFRTSYGQNNLKHSIEVAFIGGMLAAELGADVKLAKTACLLHDLGKAVDHEIEGPHAVLGADIMRKFNLPAKLINAVEGHHEDVPMESIEAIIVQAADCISGARPGARRDSMENYIQRLTQLENIAKSFPGVAEAFAIQAGREVRVIVKPEQITDLESLKLSKAIAEKVEGEMAYPGQIRINVIRETRAVEYAK